MLRKSTKEWLMKEKELRKPKTLSERARLFRIRRTATKAIEDLTFLLEHLNEGEIERIFSVEHINPFLESLLSLIPEDIMQLERNREDKEAVEEYFSKRSDWLESDAFKKRQERVFGYWRQILKEINVDYISTLVGTENRTLIDYVSTTAPPRGELLKVISWLSLFKK